MLISVVYSEIVIKGGNRRAFEGLLIGNISAALGKPADLRVHRLPGRVLLRSDSLKDEVFVRDALTRTFGIDYVS